MSVKIPGLITLEIDTSAALFVISRIPRDRSIVGKFSAWYGWWAILVTAFLTGWHWLVSAVRPDLADDFSSICGTVETSAVASDYLLFLVVAASVGFVAVSLLLAIAAAALSFLIFLGYSLWVIVADFLLNKKSGPP